MTKNMKLPLTYTEIVDEIVQLTTLSREEVEHRVWMQALQPGWNVLQDGFRFGATLHLKDEKMDQLYKQGNGFVFETLVYWTKPEHYHWTEQIFERTRFYAIQRDLLENNDSILICNDSKSIQSILPIR